MRRGSRQRRRRRRRLWSSLFTFIFFVKPKLFQNELRPTEFYYFVPIQGSPFTSTSQNNYIRQRTQQPPQQQQQTMPSKQQQPQQQQQQPSKQQPAFSPSAAMQAPTENAPAPTPMV